MYVKLFSSLYQGTLRGRTNELLVFTNLLAHADQHGIVDMHWNAIAEETGLTKEEVQTAINNLEAPDPESRSPEQDGRRITRMDEHRAWGWHVVNYGKYRAIKNEDDRREQNRLAQERFRNKHSSASVSICQHRKPRSAQADTDTDKETALSDKSDFDHWYSEYPRKEARAKAEQAWNKLKPDIDALLAAVRWQKVSGCLQNNHADGRSLIPLPASWLNGKRWLDEKPIVPVRSAA